MSHLSTFFLPKILNRCPAYGRAAGGEAPRPPPHMWIAPSPQASAASRTASE